MRIRSKLLIAISVPVGLLVLQIGLVNFFVRELQEAVTFISVTQDIIEDAFSSDDLITELRDEAKRLPSSFVSERKAGDEGLRAFNQKFDVLALQLRSILASETTRSAAGPSVVILEEALGTAQSELDDTNAELALAGDMDTLLERAVFLDTSLVLLSSTLGELTRDLRGDLQIAVDREREIHNRPIIAGLAVGGLSIFVLLGFTWLVVDRQFVSRLTGLSQSMLSIAAGKLDIEIEKPKGHDEVDEMVRTIETFRITARERNRLLKDQERTAERLEAEVADRTAELERANNFKSRFLASASHDLRQPLQALNLFIGQLGETTEAEERKRLEGRVSDAAATMNGLFDALLDMSKLEAGVLVPEVKSVRLSDLFERLKATFTATACKRGISLRFAPTTVWVHSDAILLERILLNLVSNAISATDKGGVLVGCRARDDNIRIDVIDTGCGISDKQKPLMFQEFYRLETNSSNNTDRLGLGLAIVDGLARLLDHQVSVASVPGRGSRFSITLPPAMCADTQPTLEPGFDPIAGKWILIIDDDVLVSESMCGLLESWGCHAMAAETDDRAIQIAVSQAPDLLISDFRLSHGQTGLDVISRIRDVTERSVPALLITAETAPDRLRDAKQSGFLMLHKPVTPMALRALVSRLLSEP